MVLKYKFCSQCILKNIIIDKECLKNLKFSYLMTQICPKPLLTELQVLKISIFFEEIIKIKD